MNELQLTGAGTGKTIAARIRKASDLAQVLNTSTGAFEVWSDANLVLYRISLTEVGGGAYQGNLPTLSGGVALTAGTYLIEFEDTINGSSDAPFADPYEWDGSERVRIASRLSQTAYVAPILQGTVSDDADPTTTSCAIEETLSSIDNIYSDAKMFILFTSGENQGIKKAITAWSSDAKRLAFKAFPVVPEAGDTFWIVN